MIDLEETADGVIIPVRAQPRARRSGITGIHAGRLKIAVTAAPEKGKANSAIAAVLAETLVLRPSQIALVGGAASALKRFLVTGTTRERLFVAIAAALPPLNGPRRAAD